MKLSDLLKKRNGKKKLIDLEVKALNINKGCNPELERRSKTLSDYAAFIAKVREYEGKFFLDEAIRLAVKYCMDNGILVEYLEQNSSGVINMLTAEFNMEEALNAARWEGVEKELKKEF